METDDEIDRMNKMWSGWVNDSGERLADAPPFVKEVDLFTKLVIAVLAQADRDALGSILGSVMISMVLHTSDPIAAWAEISRMIDQELPAAIKQAQQMHDA